MQSSPTTTICIKHYSAVTWLYMEKRRPPTPTPQKRGGGAGGELQMVVSPSPKIILHTILLLSLHALKISHIIAIKRSASVTDCRPQIV